MDFLTESTGVLQTYNVQVPHSFAMRVMWCYLSSPLLVESVACTYTCLVFVINVESNPMKPFKGSYSIYTVYENKLWYTKPSYGLSL